MQFTIPAPETYEKIGEGVYRGSDDNLYQEERVLRYRIYYLRSDDTTSDNWSLHSSFTSEEPCQAEVARLNKTDRGLFTYYFKDNGKPTTIKRLIY
jgi:hypothetical protein|tara:strand:+ start:69 stop:356 length:288 start_codon:yes stop_codon:yes gene_type:complete